MTRYYLLDYRGPFFYNSLIQTFSYQYLAFDRRRPDLDESGTIDGGGDKQWHAIDNNPTSTGFGFQHQIWGTGGNNYGGRQYSRFPLTQGRPG